MFIELIAAAALSSAVEPAQAQSRVAPRGDYTRSCSGAYVNRGRLYADCRTRGNGVRGSSIELNRCGDEDIRNDDGLLVCGRWRGDYEDRPNGGGGGGWPGPGGPGGPGGGWGGGRNEITVYADARYSGESRSFRGEMPNLRNTGFNDRISSMQFRGAWEVCTEAYFRGRCTVFDNDVWNLAQLGLNDQISSLRPVRDRR